jgi:hypothetical protein
MITAKRVRELFNYDPSTGILTRRIAVGSRGRKGDIPGTDNMNGYRRIIVDHKKYYAHRLAWLHTFGYMPAAIDHIDGDSTNNRIDNLRPATQSQNLMNRKSAARNTSGFKGVCWDGRYVKKWKAQIQTNGENIYLGTFATPEEAHAAYVIAAKKLHGEFHHT